MWHLRLVKVQNGLPVWTEQGSISLDYTTVSLMLTQAQGSGMLVEHHLLKRVRITYYT